MYMQNHRCKVTGSTSTKKLGTPKAPVWCKEDPSKCVAGPKQMMAWNRKSCPLIYLIGSVLTWEIRGGREQCRGSAGQDSDLQ